MHLLIFIILVWKQIFSSVEEGKNFDGETLKTPVTASYMTRETNEGMHLMSYLATGCV